MKKTIFGLIFGGLMAATVSATPISTINATGYFINGLTASSVSFSPNPLLTTTSPASGCVSDAASGSLACGPGTAFTLSNAILPLSTGSVVFNFNGSNVTFQSSSFSGSTALGDVTMTGTYSGSNALILNGSSPGTLQITWQGSASSTNPVSFSMTGFINPTPEPGSLALMGSGLLGLGFLARKRQARK